MIQPTFNISSLIKSQDVSSTHKFEDYVLVAMDIFPYCKQVKIDIYLMNRTRMIISLLKRTIKDYHMLANNIQINFPISLPIL